MSQGITQAKVLQPVLSKGVPSLLGHHRSQQVTSTHVTRAQKSGQHRTQMGKTLRSVSSGLHGTHREGGEDSRLSSGILLVHFRNWRSRKESESRRDEGSDFPRQSKIKLP